jgi:hypothetical protein
MEYRILTGVLIPRHILGNATIHFNPHGVTGDADGANLAELGNQGDFKQPPGGFVSLKHLTVQDRYITFDNSARTETEQFQIEDHPPTVEQMVVRWRATNGAEIKEIAYMIIGEA